MINLILIYAIVITFVTILQAYTIRRLRKRLQMLTKDFNILIKHWMILNKNNVI